MKVLLILCMMATIMVFNAFADDSEPDPIFCEGFEDDFPPESWSIVSKDGKTRWNKVESAFDGSLKALDRDYFAFIDGEAGEEIDEMMVTFPISLFGCDKVAFACYAAEEGQTFSDHDLTIEISKDFDSEEKSHWEVGYSWSNNKSSNQNKSNSWELIWLTFENLDASKIWIGIRYTGNDGVGMAVENVRVSSFCNNYPKYGSNCYEIYEGDDDEDDDDDNDEANKDDDPSTGSGQANDDGQCGGCAFGAGDFSIPLAMGMVLIGLFALNVARKKQEDNDDSSLGVIEK